MPRSLLGDPQAAGLTLISEIQTAGRGRKGRPALDRAGGERVAVHDDPAGDRRDRSLLAVPFWTALAVAEGVESGCGVRLDLRLPNDLDLRGRKAGGISASAVTGGRAHVGCGIGLNVVRPPLGRAGRHRTAAGLPQRPSASRRPRRNPGRDLGAMDGLLDVLDRPAEIARAWEERAQVNGGAIVYGSTPMRASSRNGDRNRPRRRIEILRETAGVRIVHLADARVLVASGDVT